MLFPAVLMNIPNSKVYLKGEWSINQFKTEPAYYSIHSALLNTFINASYAILVLEVLF